MDLQEFVRTTLVDIMEGIRSAQAANREHGASDGSLIVLGRGTDDEFVEFDLQVTTAESEGKKGGVAVVTGLFGAGVQGQTNTSTGSASRVKFRVKVRWPFDRAGRPA